MPSFKTTRQVPYSATQMYDLVADVARYPEFLPLCEALTIRQRTETADGKPQLVADMTCGYKAIRETFTTRVTLDEERRAIHVEYIDGPFRYLNNDWRFEPAANGGCRVHFHIDYALKSAMLGLLVGTMFDKAFRRFTAAFETRAAKVYGPPGFRGSAQQSPA
jgi:coenzyme Q-binding protein COQ10